MGAELVTIIASAVVALIGAVSGVMLARSKAAETANALVKTALECWQSLADERQEEIDRLKRRLESVECRLAETEKQLVTERDRNKVLEEKVHQLEAQRAELLGRIAELEKARPM